MIVYCVKHSYISNPPWAKDDCLQSAEDMRVAYTIAIVPSKNSFILEIPLELHTLKV